MTIHQILSEGAAVQLGPITIGKTYPRKPGDKNRFVLIKDVSGTGALKIWGAAANTELQEGQVLTLIATGPKGGIKTSEYNGKTSIDANDCRIEFAGEPTRNTGSPAEHSVEQVGYNAPQQTYQATTSSMDGKIHAVAKQAAKSTAIYIDELVVNHGFTKDEAIMLAQGAHGMMPLWWFGEKGIA